MTRVTLHRQNELAEKLRRVSVNLDRHKADPAPAAAACERFRADLHKAFGMCHLGLVLPP